MRRVVGDAARWGDQEHLLADLIDVLQVANWQRAGKRNARRPKPVSRPGQKSDGERFGATKRKFTVEQMADIQANWGRLAQSAGTDEPHA